MEMYEVRGIHVRKLGCLGEIVLLGCLPQTGYTRPRLLALGAIELPEQLASRIGARLVLVEDRAFFDRAVAAGLFRPLTEEDRLAARGTRVAEADI